MKLSDAIFGFYLHISTSPNYSSITAKYYRDCLNRLKLYLRDPEFESITKEQLLSFLATFRQRGLKPNTTYVYYRVIRSLYNWSEKEIGINRPDTYDFPRPMSTEVIPYTNTELKRMYAVQTSTRNKAILYILLDTGLRVSELSRLSIGDVNIETGRIIVKPFETGIKSKSREVWLSPKSINVVWKYLANRKQKDRLSPFISTMIDETTLDRFEIRKIVLRIANQAKVDGATPHRFRHTFAIEYLRNGGDIFTLKRLLGHSSMKMVEVYLQIAQADVENAHHKASPIENLRL